MSSGINRNNDNFKRLRAALELSKQDLYTIFKGRYSKSQIDSWSRSENALKNASGNSRASVVPRFRPMSDEAFDLFCEGLLERKKNEDL